MIEHLAENVNKGGQTASIVLIILGLLLIAIGIGAVLVLLRGQASKQEWRSEEFRLSVSDILSRVRRQPDMPRRMPTLEEEIATEATTLTGSVNRLRELSAKAERFSDEVNRLAERAEGLRATARINEGAAQKIAAILAERSEEKLKLEVERLTNEFTIQLAKSQKDGRRLAWITFAAGGLLGFLVNLLTTWMFR